MSRTAGCSNLSVIFFFLRVLEENINISQAERLVVKQLDSKTRRDLLQS